MNNTNSTTVPTFTPYVPAYSTKRTRPTYTFAAHNKDQD
jgi:hypothetical protein